MNGAVSAFVLLLASAVPLGVEATRGQSNERPPVSGQIGAPSAGGAQFFASYCTFCHNQRSRTAGLALDTIDTANLVENGRILEKVVQKLRARQMPPIGQKRPAQAESDEFASRLESELDRASSLAPNPGRTQSLHLLNRTEYHNAIRDLLALDVDVTTLLPADDSSYGFDNIAGVLKISQSRMERYLTAARKISQIAVGASAAPVAMTFEVSPETPQDAHVEGLPFGTRGGLVIDYNVPQAGEYKLEVKLLCVSTMGGDENCDGAGGFAEAHQMDVLVDDARVHSFTIEPRARRERFIQIGNAREVAKEERWIATIPIKAGPRRLGVTFVEHVFDDAVQAGHRRPFEKPFNVSRGMEIKQPYIHRVVLSGPFSAKGAGDTPSRRAVFACRPPNGARERQCARTIFSKLARKAYRRPPTAVELDDLLTFYDAGRVEGGFEEGIEQGLRTLLVKPQFLFRIERDPAGAAPGSVYRISDLELASRLSFFLWSSIPDEELLTAATTGRLKTSAGLAAEVRRLLSSPRADALTTNFAVQWLQLRNLGAVKPNPGLFPDFDESLRSAMQRETELFFQSIVREDRSVVDLLAANYTFLNGRLARHYGIHNVGGSQFQRVVLDANTARGGLLGHASILTITSHANRNSPVKRGKWVLDNILGTPPPPPPANVPPLPETATQGKVLSVRERMAEHRRNPACAACHALIDPAGFALDNFDPIGRYRTVDAETYAPVDASGVLPDGSKFDGLASFKALLIQQPDRFVTTVVEKLMTYALGRGLEHYDMPAVRKIVRDSAKEHYRFWSLIMGVVRSVPFQMRKVMTEARSASAEVSR